MQCDGWINEAGQFLLNIGRKATECKSSSDAADLISQLNNYKEEGGAKQNERLNGMELTATGLYGEAFLTSHEMVAAVTTIHYCNDERNLMHVNCFNLHRL